jgi:hypothetical protein
LSFLEHVLQCGHADAHEDDTRNVQVLLLSVYAHAIRDEHVFRLVYEAKRQQRADDANRQVDVEDPGP